MARYSLLQQRQVRLDNDLKSAKLSLTEKFEKLMNEKFQALKTNSELEQLATVINSKIQNIESKILTIDDEIKEFFGRPIDPKASIDAPINESILSLKPGTESGRLSMTDLYELKTRFNRLQYDCNR